MSMSINGVCDDAKAHPGVISLRLLWQSQSPWATAFLSVLHPLNPRKVVKDVILSLASFLSRTLCNYETHP